MWWAGSRGRGTADVFLGDRLVAVAHPASEFRHDRVDGPGGACERVHEWLGTARARRLRVWLSGALCEPFLLPDIAGAASPQELRLAASALAPGSTTLGDACDVWIDDAAGPGARLAAAVPGGLAQELTAGLAPAGRVLAIRPWWGEALRWSLKHASVAPQLLGVDDGESLTLLGGADGRFDVASGIARMQDPEAGRMAWARALLASDKPADRTLLLRLSFEAPSLQPAAGCAFGRWLQVDRAGVVR